MKLTVAVFTKLLPVSVRVKSGAPAFKVCGFMDESVGTEFKTVNVVLFDNPHQGSGFEAVTSRCAPVSRSPAVSSIWIFVGLMRVKAF